MGNKDHMDKEIEASKRRAERMKEISQELESTEDSPMAKILAEIEAKNKKTYTEET